MGELRRAEGGFSAPIMVLIMAMMVLFIGGISIDLWRVIADHREVSGLADGAAIPDRQPAGAASTDEEAIERHIGAVLALPVVDVDAIRARQFTVALDCVRGVGGGIVWDSDPEEEVEESWTKARPLLEAIDSRHLTAGSTR